jgi:hypothetical protein
MDYWPLPNAKCDDSKCKRGDGKPQADFGTGIRSATLCGQCIDLGRLNDIIFGLVAYTLEVDKTPAELGAHWAERRAAKARGKKNPPLLGDPAMSQRAYQVGRALAKRKGLLRGKLTTVTQAMLCNALTTIGKPHKLPCTPCKHDSPGTVRNFADKRHW